MGQMRVSSCRTSRRIWRAGLRILGNCFCRSGRGGSSGPPFSFLWREQETQIPLGDDNKLDDKRMGESDCRLLEDGDTYQNWLAVFDDIGREF